MEKILILQPVGIMFMLSLFVTIMMLKTRIKAMKLLKIHPQMGQETTKLKELLPMEVNRIANNYNHLFEQPILFYTAALIIFVTGIVDSINITAAWGYVVARVFHSLIQITVDKVIYRFGFFMLSWIFLAILVLQIIHFVFFKI